jgi:ferritin-like metal-binding protein YciE
VAKISNLQDLLVNELRDLYSAEKQLTKALPKMAKAAADEELAQAFKDHLEQTQGHLQRLEDALGELESSTRGKPCAGMAGLIEEGGEMISENAPDVVKDAGLIGAAQRVEHYEIAAYGTAAAFAQELGLDRVADLLNETLEEEKETDALLTELASRINTEAAQPEEEEEEGEDDEESESDEEEETTAKAPARRGARSR